MAKNILITGSAGFIGFALSKFLLDAGHHVHGYDGMTDYYDVQLKRERNKILTSYENFSFTEGMLENQEVLEKTAIQFKPEIILHLAAQAGVRYSIERPKVYINSNIIGTFNIIELANKLKVNHLLIASSSSVYGANKNIPYQEIDKTQTQLSIYAATKKLQRVLRILIQIYGNFQLLCFDCLPYTDLGADLIWRFLNLQNQ